MEYRSVSLSDQEVLLLLLLLLLLDAVAARKTLRWVPRSSKEAKAR